MDSLRIAANIAYGVLACLAWAVVRSDRGHAPLAAFASWMVGSDFLRLALKLHREGAPRPYVGLPRVAFHGEQLVVLSWNFLFVALCLHHFTRLSPKLALFAWALTLAVCVAGYPALTRAPLIQLYSLVLTVSIVCSWSCIFWGMMRRDGVAPGLVHLVLILFAVTDVSTYFAAYARGFIADWQIIQIANMMLVAACSVAHVWHLRKSRDLVEAPA